MDLMKKEVIVLNATQYQMTDTETGEINEGTSVRYLITNNLAPCAEEQQKGYKLAKARVGFNSFNDFPEVPGIYEADLDVRINKDGVAMVVANSFTFKKSLTGK